MCRIPYVLISKQIVQIGGNGNYMIQMRSVQYKETGYFLYVSNMGYFLM